MSGRCTDDPEIIGFIFLPLSFCLLEFAGAKMETERERQKNKDNNPDATRMPANPIPRDNC